MTDDAGGALWDSPETVSRRRLPMHAVVRPAVSVMVF